MMLLLLLLLLDYFKASTSSHHRNNHIMDSDKSKIITSETNKLNQWMKGHRDQEDGDCNCLPGRRGVQPPRYVGEALGGGCEAAQLLSDTGVETVKQLSFLHTNFFV